MLIVVGAIIFSFVATLVIMLIMFKKLPFQYKMLFNRWKTRRIVEKSSS